MLRVWCLLCLIFESGVSSSGVSQMDERGELTIKDAASAGIMLVRMKRSPARTLTMSGYMPNGGLSYASTDAMFPYSYGPMDYGGMDMWPYSGQMKPRTPSKELEPPARSDTYGPPDEGTIPMMGNEPSWPEKEGSVDNNSGMTTYTIPKKPKKKWPQKISSPTTADEDEEEYHRGGSDGSAKAHASFNAWFPIMLGVFPYGQGGGGPGEAAQRGPYTSSSPSYSSQGPHGTQGTYGSQGPHGAQGTQGSQGSQGPYGSQGPQNSGGTPSHAPLQRHYSTTVIANSVNNGKSGIASSTATAYGGEHRQ